MNPQSSGLSASPASAFTTNENKALLWSVLHGGGKFIGIPDKHLHNIQEMFEVTIREMSEHYRRLNQSTDLNTMNKEAVVVICKKIEIIKQQSHLQPQQQQIQHNFQIHQNYQKKQQQIPQLETIYRAEDLQKERQNVFQNEFKKKEKEMSSILKLKKPEEINFTDDTYDKPIGDDMERLLAEALASRERELEQIKNVTFTTPPALQPSMPTSTSTSTSTPETCNSNQEFINYKTMKIEKHQNQNGNDKSSGNIFEKRVSFGKELHIIENNDNDNEIIEDDEENGDISSIFNKLKKIKIRKNESDGEHISNVDVNQNNQNNQNNHDRIMIMQLSEDVKYIKNTLSELTEKINKLSRHENEKNEIQIN